MTNDDKLTEAIQLIKAGNKEAARAVLEPFLLKNPSHIQAWMWETELFSSDREKIKVLEVCLKQNPGNPKVIQALTFFKKRAGLAQPPVAPAPAPSAYPPPSPLYPEPEPSSYRTPAPVEPASSVSPFSTSRNWSDSEDSVTSLRPTEAESYLVERPQPVESPRSPQPVTPKKAKLQKKPTRLSPRMMKVILVVLACMSCLVFSGFYVGGGYYLSGQINQAFAGQNCAEVVQQAAFVSFYPQGIFGPMLTGYDQLAECQVKLGVEQAVAAKDWGGAVALAQQYLSTYPSGTFAKDFATQAPEFLSTWSGELLASHNYGTGIEKLKLLLETYPDSPPAQTATETILKTYLLWAKDLTGKQNYKEAEPILLVALSYFKADPARSEQIKQELVDLYVAWGDQQVQLGDIDNGTSAYKKAGEISPEKVDAELLIARANLQRAIGISETKNFDKALDRVKEVSDAAQADNVKAEANAARETILNAYSFSNSPQAMEQLTAAITLACQGERPELPIFGLDTEKIRFGLNNAFATLPPDWAAGRPSELHYVLCVDETKEEIQTCKYTGAHFLIRMRYIWKITLYDMLTGDASISKSLKGADPGKCPPFAGFSSISAVSRSFGPRPSVEKIVEWLTQLNLTQ